MILLAEPYASVPLLDWMEASAHPVLTKMCIRDSVNAEVDLGTWPIPPVVRFACEQANLSEAEALKTFNMGLGMVLIVDPTAAEDVEAALAAAGEEPYRVGRIVAGEGEVQYANEGELF